MNNNECQFELTEQPCIECGKPTGQLGTCRDVIFCAECRQAYIEIEGERNASELFVIVAEKTPYLYSEVDDVQKDVWGDDE